MALLPTKVWQGADRSRAWLVVLALQMRAKSRGSHGRSQGDHQEHLGCTLPYELRTPFIKLQTHNAPQVSQFSLQKIIPDLFSLNKLVFPQSIQ